jgi:hypothetical protein
MENDLKCFWEHIRELISTNYGTTSQKCVTANDIQIGHVEVSKSSLTAMKVLLALEIHFIIVWKSFENALPKFRQKCCFPIKNQPAYFWREIIFWKNVFIIK